MGVGDAKTVNYHAASIANTSRYPTRQMASGQPPLCHLWVGRGSYDQKSLFRSIQIFFFMIIFDRRIEEPTYGPTVTAT